MSMFDLPPHIARASATYFLGEKKLKRIAPNVIESLLYLRGVDTTGTHQEWEATASAF